MVGLQPVGRDNWRACVALDVAQPQRQFVSPVHRYLNLCAYGGTPWHPLAVEVDGSIVGFAMWAIDPDDGSYWIGGLVIDTPHQGKGYGRATVRELIAMAVAGGHPSVGLSYSEANVAARALYAGLGFVGTDEQVDGETVARLVLARDPARPGP